MSGQTRAELAGRAARAIDWPKPAGRRTAVAGGDQRAAPDAAGQRQALGHGDQPRGGAAASAAINSGYTIRQRVAPLQQAVPGKWTRGDLARVTLTIDAQADMGWVVVDAPLPAGATVLGSGLLGESACRSRQAQQRESAWLAFEERPYDRYRAYYAWVPKGAFTLEYTLRLNNPGRFKLPTTRVEAMYQPEQFGELPNEDWVVMP